MRRRWHPGAVLAVLATAAVVLTSATAAHAIPGLPDCSAQQARVPGGQSQDCSVGSQVAAGIGGLLQNTVVKAMADELAKFTGDLLHTGLTWWLTTDSIRLARTGAVGDPADQQALNVTVGLQGICVGIGMLIAVLLLIFAGIRTMIQRKSVHLLQAAQGLLINSLVTVMGVTVIDSLLIASDALTRTILQVAFGQKSGDQIAALMVGVLINPQWGPTATLVMCVIVLLVGVGHLAAMFLRQAAIPVQALLLPIAGAGQIGSQRTREWLPRLFTSIITVIAYKPLAAFLIGIGFTELAGGAGALDWIRGIVTLVLSVLALQGLMALFAPLGVSMAGAASGGGFAHALSDVAAMALMRRGGGDAGAARGTSAVEHAQQMARTGPAAAGRTAGIAGGPAAAAIGAARVGQAALTSAASAMSGQDPGGASGTGSTAGPGGGGGPGGAGSGGAGAPDEPGRAPAAARPAAAERQQTAPGGHSGQDDRAPAGPAPAAHPRAPAAAASPPPPGPAGPVPASGQGPASGPVRVPARAASPAPAQGPDPGTGADEPARPRQAWTRPPRPGPPPAGWPGPAGQERQE
jgi:type IV secretion system protein TrbL